MLAVSIISGMSREKPAEVRVRWMEWIWSAYEVMGEEMMLGFALSLGNAENGVLGRTRLVLCALLASGRCWPW